MSSIDLQYEQAVDELAEGFAEEVRVLAKDCVRAFPIGKHRVQVSQIEQTARAAHRFHDIIAFAMRQTGKSKANEGWMAPCANGPFGKQMVDFLEKLQARVDERCQEEKYPDKQRNALRLRVTSICLRNVNSAYLYYSLPEAQ